MGDKSPKSKARDQKQKEVVRKHDQDKASAKQQRQGQQTPGKK